jgi:CHASE3 domain sensor protein
MDLSLRSKLSLSIALVVLLTVALISFLSNYLIRNQFEDYVTNQQQKAAHQIVRASAFNMTLRRLLEYGFYTHHRHVCPL